MQTFNGHVINGQFLKRHLYVLHYKVITKIKRKMAYC